MTNLGWTNGQVTTLSALWAEGWSAAQIAAALKLSRNAVIGKVHRLRLPERATTLRATGPVRPPRPKAPPRSPSQKREKVVRPRVSHITGQRAQRPAVPDYRPPRSDAWTPLPGITPVTLEHMTGCKWPVSDPFWPRGSVDLFCNCEQQPGSSYCPAHTKRAGGGFPVPRKTEPARSQLTREMA